MGFFCLYHWGEKNKTQVTLIAFSRIALTDLCGGLLLTERETDILQRTGPQSQGCPVGCRLNQSSEYMGLHPGSAV